MKIDTTVALSEEILAALNRRAPDAQHRSEIVEAALRAYLLRLRRRGAFTDLAVINANAAELNAEAEDVLSYQVIS
jgi:metal-responsive CopG/Arc/MetJ family transcriptional regulator